MSSGMLETYVSDLAVQNVKTATVARHFMADYADFVTGKFHTDLDAHVHALRTGQVDVYDALRAYVHYLDQTKLKTGLNSPLTVSQKVKTAKRFLEYSDVDISTTKFRMKVKMPKSVKREKTALTKEVVRDILNACQDIRLKTFVMWLASSGARSTESMAIRLQDIDFTQSPPVVHIHGENTKTRQDRHTYLTKEMHRQLEEWLLYKYRPRENVLFDKSTQTWKHVKINPVRRPTDFVFLPYHEDESMHEGPKTLEYAYNNMERSFIDLLNRLGFSKGSNGKHYKITFHSFRRFVYTTIDSLGLNQFAEYYIGHGASEYWSKPEKEKVETFRRIEPYLTFLDVTQLEATTADLETQLKAKDFEILQLKGQMSSVMQQLQEIKQNTSIVPEMIDVATKAKAAMAETQDYIKFLESKAGGKKAYEEWRRRKA